MTKSIDFFDLFQLHLSKFNLFLISFWSLLIHFKFFDGILNFLRNRHFYFSITGPAFPEFEFFAALSLLLSEKRVKFVNALTPIEDRHVDGGDGGAWGQFDDVTGCRWLWLWWWWWWPLRSIGQKSSSVSNRSSSIADWDIAPSLKMSKKIYLKFKVFGWLLRSLCI